MTAYNLRSLLVAAIFLSNCITWTASRHHHTHNVSGHRSRHRRQDVNSYVLPGGEGEGWGEWGPASPCSRSCGGGVASQKRICLRVGAEGQQCTGGDTKYFSCEIQDCPEGSVDFRTQQCSEFNDKPFRGNIYEWIPFTKAPNPCELNCMPRGDHFYYRHVAKVIDGTRCNADSFDMCVDGQCQTAGCDKMLGSSAREDKCRQCHGTGTNCHTTKEVFTSPDFTKGYNDILLIPEGSTNINITERQSSNNYLGLRALNGTYYLNGNYRIDLPKSVMIGGALWHYERDQYGLASPDKLRCLGPTKEPLYLSMYLLDNNVDIEYEYSVPNNTAPPTDERYHWVHKAFEPCTLTCGGGYQTRNVTCRSTDGLKVVDDVLCDEVLKPASTQPCNTQPCPARWRLGAWGDCSQTCGEGGVRSRNVTCETDGKSCGERDCLNLLGPKPEVEEKCNEDVPCPKWFVGRWKECDRLCGKGEEVRKVICHVKENGRVKILKDTDCTEKKPEETRPCLKSYCDGVDWVFSEWTTCDSCLSTTSTRHVLCATNNIEPEVVNDTFCAHHNKPQSQQPCTDKPACETMWYATQWGKCSVECGEGVQGRRVFCGSIVNGAVVEVEESECDPELKYRESKPCLVPLEQCPPQWVMGAWAACPCDGGIRHRQVMCVKGQETFSNCSVNLLVDTSQICQNQSCDIVPTTPAENKEGLPYCDEIEYKEVGADLDIEDELIPVSTGRTTSSDEIYSGSGSTSADISSSVDDDDSGSGLEGSGNDPKIRAFSTNDDTTTDANDSTDTFSDNTTGDDSSISVTTESSNKTTDSIDTVGTDTVTGSTVEEEETVTEAGSVVEKQKTKYATLSPEGAASQVTTTISSDRNDASTTEKSTASNDDETSTSDGSDGITPALGPSTEETTIGTLPSEITHSDSDNQTTGSNSDSQTTVSDSDDQATGSKSDDQTTEPSPPALGDVTTTSGPVTSETSDADSQSTLSDSDNQTTETSTSALGVTTISLPVPSETSDADSQSTGSNFDVQTTETSTSALVDVTTISGPEASETSDADSRTTGSNLDNQTTETSTSALGDVTTISGPAASETSDADSQTTGSNLDNETTETSTSALRDVTTISGPVPSETSDADNQSTGSNLDNQTTETSTSALGDVTTISGPVLSEISDADNETTGSDFDSQTTETSTSALGDVTSISGPVPSETSDADSQTTGSDFDSQTTETSTPALGEVTTISGPVPSETSDADSQTTGSNFDNQTTKTSTPALGEVTTISGSVASETSDSAGQTTESDSNSQTTVTSTLAAGPSIEVTTLGSVPSVTTESDSDIKITETSTLATGPSIEVTTLESVPSVTTGSDSDIETTVTSTLATGSSIEVTTLGSVPSVTTEFGSDSETTVTSTAASGAASEVTSTSTPSGTALTEKPTTINLEFTHSQARDIFSTPQKPMCIPRPCEATVFGCCPDRKTIATGPFDLGCKKPRNCHETEYGCCPDGVLPAQGEDNQGCPVTPCAETLYGCCPDNKTAAEGNDQQGCPYPTPPCKFSNFGCCVDNETEALGPDQEGCPGKETTVASTPITTSDTEAIETSSVSASDSITTSEPSSVSDINTSAVTETGTSQVPEASTTEVTEEGTSTVIESSSVSHTGTSAVTDERTSHTTEVGTTEVTEEGSTISSVSSSVSDIRTSAVTEEGTSYITETGRTDITENGTSTVNESSRVSGFQTSAVTEAGTSHVTEEGTSHITEEETSTSSESSSSSEVNTSAVTEAGTSNATEEGTRTSSEFSSSSETETTTVTTEYTTIIDDCWNTMFGCCYDNETAATGADGSGCPCNATEFGCCPDGESTAEGPEQRGCRGACRNSQYGCCSDGETPAHGPNAEGCCLLTAFGCCPDNRKPAQGPHLEGCECQSYQYGCCPDQNTAAAGPNNEGCGCQYTQHGCCPDRHTEATGPENEGCPCSTFQYGCCPDGVTIAKGPQQQGCHCRDSPFKCCGDGETPANSVDSADCGCAASKYGCCPDGITTAEGSNFLGCTDVPENKQAGCGLPMDNGSGHNYTVAWYYDITYGGCAKFWYWGRDGNSNRFATKEICEDICVQPAPKDACKLPAVKGACNGNTMRWYYDGEREECIPFTYGGCLGNDNNFNTRELCQAQCKPDTSTDLCSLPIERGSCAGNYSRWGFDQERGRCEQFTWGGCEGTGNRFQTEAACNHRCSPLGAAAPRCTAPQVAGTCAEKEALWSFSQTENRCVPFYYSGCGGNDNRFDSRSSCEHYCPSAYEPNKCTLPYATGECADYTERWFYDTSIQRCRQFWYGGCGGNANKFESEAECKSTCSERLTTTTTPVTTTTTTTTRVSTTTTIPTPKDICQLPMATGPCDESLMRWFYNADTDTCSQFTYGGCEGNDNRFESRDACENTCRDNTPAIVVDEVCRISEDLEPCSEAGLVWFYDPDVFECVKHENWDSGERCRTTGVFASEEACLRSCGSFKGIDWCAVDKDPGPCTTYEMKVYFDIQGGFCRYYQYGGCFGGANRFSTMEECQQVCKTSVETTTVTTTKLTTTTTPAPPPARQAAPDCRISEDLEPCSEAGEVWFYDPNVYECVKHENSDSGESCRTTGVFPSEEACLRSCEYPSDIDVCAYRLDPGPCQSSIPKYYWEETSARCELFAYGGCGGGYNRFSTLEDCEQICGNRGPPPYCHEQVDSGNSCRQPSSVRWYYDPTRGLCAAFAYLGCGGNGNNFGSYEACKGACRPFGDVPPTIEEPNCTRYEEECQRLRCGYDVNYSYTNEGCVQCACLPPPAPDCGPARAHCETLSCTYGVRKVNGSDGCDSCECNEDPCTTVQCGPTERCVAEAYRDADQQPRYSARCVPQPEKEYPPTPVAGPEQETNFSSGVGGTVTLRCVFHSNPPPKITWRRGEVTIDGPMDRYRLMSDGALEIVALRQTDSGVYICVADNGLGIAQQEIHLKVYDETNEVDPCEQYTRECTQLSCEYNVRRALTAEGCTRCTCEPLVIDCAPFRKQCQQLKCAYGIDSTVPSDGCPRCHCAAHPCSAVRCGADESCAVLRYRDAATHEPRFTTECRKVNKPGMCPAERAEPNEVCYTKCTDDSACRGDGKCCQRGCSRLCMKPVPPTPATTTIFTTTHLPELPRVPRIDPRQETSFTSSEGGKATLRCLFHSNPPPKITWRHGEVTIEGDVDRYRLLSDGALEIVSLYRNDSGVYVCVADNGVGVTRQEIRLVVADPVDVAVGIAGDKNAEIIGTLDEPLTIRCLAYGYPTPEVFWIHDRTIVPFIDPLYLARGNELLIRRLAIDTLGEYKCQAYNGKSTPVSWVVAVKAYRPVDVFTKNKYLVSRTQPLVAPVYATTRKVQPTAIRRTRPITELPVTYLNMPVVAHIQPPSAPPSVGGELSLVCEIDGFPDPEVYWTKDNTRLYPGDRNTITGSSSVSRLTIVRLAASDAGLYGCHVKNDYSVDTATTQITIKQDVYVPPRCTDNPYFAKCSLIVRNNFCRHKYYGNFCCKSCVEAGQIAAEEAMQADQPSYRRK